MPFLYLDGKLQGASSPYAARPCEWCGEPMAAKTHSMFQLDDDEPRFVTMPGMTGDWEQDKRATILLSLCMGCIHIFCEMCESEIEELPGNPTWRENEAWD